jgi:chromosome partitioning protein
MEIGRHNFVTQSPQCVTQKSRHKTNAGPSQTRQLTAVAEIQRISVIGITTTRQSNRNLESAMFSADAPLRPVRVIVVANEKGGSGKSTVAMHIAVALMKRGRRVATIDLDTRQKTFTHYIENRRAWAERVARDLESPEHLCLPTDDESSASQALADTVDALGYTHDFVVIDTPGHDGPLMRLAHSMADTLITPLNDSFVDLDVLGSLDPDNLEVTGISHYAETVEAARRQRHASGQLATDWIVLRNRLSMTPTRNKRLVGAGIEELSRRLGFRSIEGLAERVVFREFYLRGLTALDGLDEATLGKRPTMSHATARQEVETLLEAMNLSRSMESRPLAGQDRAAA